MTSLATTIRDLHRRKARERRALALAEGVRLVEEALAAGVPIQGAVAGPALEATPRGRTLKAALAAAGVAVESVTDAELLDLADTEQPQGVIAVIAPKEWALADLAPAAGRPLLVCDGVQDPGNVGAMARTALALGASGLVALPGTADLWNAKALRGSMGALFRLPSLHAADQEFLPWARERGIALWSADVAGEDVRSIGRPTGPIALLLGNEGAGVRPEIASVAVRRVAIPIQPGAESLNVAVAAGILLYEVTRGR
ncbi:MAG: TrmH family RNA methyltransferase [Gemmatimonadales bacterium]